MSDTANNDKMSSPSPTSVGRGRGRGRGRGVDNSPLRKPDSPRNANRPGVAVQQSQSPRRNSNSGDIVSGYPTNRSDDISPKTTVSDSSVATSLKTALDAKAPEFVPTSTKSVRSLPTLSVHADEFVPLQPHPPPQPLPEHRQLIGFLEHILGDLLSDPCSYDRSINNITSYLQLALCDVGTIQLACRVIFYWAVSQPNFSYICARLCEHISVHVPYDLEGRFNQHMLKRCHEEYQQINELLVSDPQHASAFAVFLAELYSREKFKIDQVLHALIDIMESMVKRLDNDLAKPVGQILKMCGGSIEDALAAQNKTDHMDELLSAITAKVSSSSGEIQLSTSMSGLLKYVLTLRAANWGRTMSPQASVPSSPAVSNFSQEPVFYSSSGSRITREEAGYAEENPELCGEEVLAGAGVSGDGQVIGLVNEEISGARGDFSESEEQTMNGDADDLDLDIIVFDDDDEMTEEMCTEYERFDAELSQNLQIFDDSNDY